MATPYPTQRQKKPPAPPEFLEAARAAALRFENDHPVLDCYIHVWDERATGASQKPKRDITYGFKNEAKAFVNFKSTLWEELAIDTGKLLAEEADRCWCQVEVDLASATLNSWTDRNEVVHNDVVVGKAWILLKDGRRVPTHEPMPPEPEPEEAFDPDEDDDPFLPDFRE